MPKHRAYRRATTTPLPVQEWLILVFGLLFLMLMVANVHASPANYESLYDDSTWRVKTGKLQCRITHTINGYGEARFSQNAGEHLNFYLHSFRPQHIDTSGRIMTASSPWHTQNRASLVTAANFTSGYIPLILSPPYSSQLLFELDEGMTPYMQFPDRMNNDKETRISLSPIRFQEAVSQFKECIHNLHPYSFSDLNNTRIFFATNSINLSPASKTKLKRIAEYVSLDNDINAIKISGFTDSRASKKSNILLSKKRSEFVAAELRSMGVKKELIEVVYHGEARPYTTNHTKRGRALNRSAIIEMVKQ